mgnify:CR=1 FL=1
MSDCFCQFSENLAELFVESASPLSMQVIQERFAERFPQWRFVPFLPYPSFQHHLISKQRQYLSELMKLEVLFGHTFHPISEDSLTKSSSGKSTPNVMIRNRRGKTTTVRLPDQIYEKDAERIQTTESLLTPETVANDHSLDLEHTLFWPCSMSVWRYASYTGRRFWCVFFCYCLLSKFSNKRFSLT